jgi:hypothetical protein
MTDTNLAWWRGEAGDAAGAVAALVELLADSERVWGPCHAITLTTRRSLGRWRAEAEDADHTDDSAGRMRQARSQWASGMDYPVGGFGGGTSDPDPSW